MCMNNNTHDDELTGFDLAESIALMNTLGVTQIGALVALGLDQEFIINREQNEFDLSSAPDETNVDESDE